MTKSVGGRPGRGEFSKQHCMQGDNEMMSRSITGRRQGANENRCCHTEANGTRKGTASTMVTSAKGGKVKEKPERPFSR